MFGHSTGVSVFIFLTGDDCADAVVVEEDVIFADVAGLYGEEFDSLGVDL